MDMQSVIGDSSSGTYPFRQSAVVCERLLPAEFPPSETQVVNAACRSLHENGGTGRQVWRILHPAFSVIATPLRGVNVTAHGVTPRKETTNAAHSGLVYNAFALSFRLPPAAVPTFSLLLPLRSRPWLPTRLGGWRISPGRQAKTKVGMRLSSSTMRRQRPAN